MPAFISRNVGDVVAELLMSRSAFSGSLLVLEGDDDVKFWKARTPGHRECQFVIAGSKPTVSGAIAIADTLKQTGILGVVDDDYDSLLGLPIPSANLVRTETRDLETLLLFSFSFEKVIAEAGSMQKIHDLEQRECLSIREAFVSRSILFGQLRFLSARNHWAVSFDRLNPWKWTSLASWTFDREAVLREMCGQVPSITFEALEQELASLAQINPWLILHGKDCLDVLAIGLRSVIGNIQYSDRRIMQMLRLAFDTAMLRSTFLYSNVKAWETLNPGYRVLLDE